MSSVSTFEDTISDLPLDSAAGSEGPNLGAKEITLLDILYPPVVKIEPTPVVLSKASVPAEPTALTIASTVDADADADGSSDPSAKPPGKPHSVLIKTLVLTIVFVVLSCPPFKKWLASLTKSTDDFSVYIVLLFFGVVFVYLKFF